ncbi:MAG: FG-GAP repeat domain-containing protein, partial [Planctomycetota bacterium]
MSALFAVAVCPLFCALPQSQGAAQAPPHGVAEPQATSTPSLVLKDVSNHAGVHSLGFGRGAAMVDLDLDGLLDLISLNGGGDNFYYKQSAFHTFDDVTDLWGIGLSGSEGEQSWAVVATDFDNDGDADVFVGVGGLYSSAPNRLWRNDLPTGGVLVDVTASAGAIGLASHTFGASSLDFDNDGLLDLFYTDAYPDPDGTSVHLLRNMGGLVFMEVSAPAGITSSGSYRGCSVGDYDNDGWIDIAVGHQGGSNLLFHNEGDGTFTEVAEAAGVARPGPNFGLMLEDFDNNGWMDIYVSQRPAAGEPSGLFKNRGNGTFKDITLQSGMTSQQEMGHNTGDIDADGYPDIFLGTGSMTVSAPDVLLKIVPTPKGGLQAVNVSSSSGLLFTDDARTHGSVFGDYDNDGDIDLYINNGGPSHLVETVENNKLMRNEGNSNSWIALDLVGVISNRAGVGARAACFTVDGKRVDRHLTAGRGFGNTDSPTLFFGLGPIEGP